MTHYVYHLIDPIDDIVRYVGKTTHPKSRLASHIADAMKRQNTSKKRWIAGLINAGEKPILKVIAEFQTEENGRIRESEECHLHHATIFNMHDPSKGAKALKSDKKWKER
jgi:hypothetical protein